MSEQVTSDEMTIEQHACRLLLDVAAHFRANPEQWIQGVPARDAAGHMVHYNSPHAVSRCLDGELCSRHDADKVYFRAAKKIKRLVIGGSFSVWNDQPGRTAAEVVELCERAAKL